MKNTLYSFKWELAETDKIVVDIFNNGLNVGYGYLVSDFTVKSSFIKIFIALENFIECSFIGYLAGHKSVNGTAPTRYIEPLDYDHAKRIITGTQRFVDWSNPDTIRKMSDIYFEKGEPFKTIIGSVHKDMLDMKTIRNACAHITTSTQANLDALVTRKTGKYAKNTNVAEFLLQIDNTSGLTFFDYYVTIIEVASEKIAQNKLD